MKILSKLRNRRTSHSHMYMEMNALNRVRPTRADDGKMLYIAFFAALAYFKVFDISQSSAVARFSQLPEIEGAKQL